MKAPTRLLLLTLATASLGCLNLYDSESGPVIAGVCHDEDSDPDMDVAFVQIQDKLKMGCSCHNPQGNASQIDATGFSVGNYAALRRGGQASGDRIIVDGKPCDSFLYKKLSDAPPTGARMPVNGPYWSRADMLLLHDWIAEGARAD
ncbi:MAG: hypothetical protein ABW252_20425 [Polyangiales bacterium]